MPYIPLLGNKNVNDTNNNEEVNDVGLGIQWSGNVTSKNSGKNGYDSMKVRKVYKTH